MTRDRWGFTLVELLVALTVAFVLMAGVHRLLLQQVRFSAWETTTSDTHDAARVLRAVLSRDIGGAVPEAGDIDVAAPDSLAIRAFSDLGFVCAVSAGTGLLSVAWSDKVGWTPDDSLRVYSSGSWRSLMPGSSVPVDLGLPCGTFSVPPDYQYLFLTLDLDTMPVGSPVRLFRWRSFHVTDVGGEAWVARSDAVSMEPLVGPLVENGLRFAYLDAEGAETPGVADATALSVVAVLERPPGPYPWSNRADTLRVLVPLQNR